MNKLQYIAILNILTAIRDELATIRETLVRAYPDFITTGSASTNTIIYPEAGERLVRVPLTDEQIMARDNKQCRRCGHWDPTRGGGKHSARHLHVVALTKDLYRIGDGIVPHLVATPGERVTLCARCKGLVEGEQG
jgi:hypothetical protein